MKNLLVIAALGQRAYGRWLFQSLLAGIIILVMLAIVISILIATTLIGGLIALYYVLLQHGFEPQIALVITGVSAILMIVMLVISMIIGLQHLRQTPRTLFSRSPLVSRAIDALTAFSDGLMAD